jgi:hypothetical protein
VSRRPTGRLAALIVTAAVLVAGNLVLQGPADAVPPRCPDGSPPPCDGDDPPETTPKPVPTTSPTPTTSPPPPPPSTWVANAVLLNQSPTPLGTVVANRQFLARRTREDIKNGVPVPDPIPGGSATLQDGSFTFAPVTQPTNTNVQIRVDDGGGRGPLCRTAPRASLPSSGGVIRILAAPPQVTGPQELNAMVSGIVGELAKEEDAQKNVKTVTATSATLAPQADGLLLTLAGNLDVDFFKPTEVDWRIGFTFRQLLTLKGSQSSSVGESLVVELTGPGSIDLTWVSGEPPEGGDGILDYVADVLVPRLRDGVLAKAGPLINPKVAQLHAVRWWTEQGFTLSIRNVSYSTAGLSVEATFCRLG